MSVNTTPRKKAYIVMDQNWLTKDTSDHKQFNYFGTACKVATMGYDAKLDFTVTAPVGSEKPVGISDIVDTLKSAKDADVWYFPAGWEESDKCVAMHEIARALNKETLEEVSATTTVK